jgi:hypothetical protein
MAIRSDGLIKIEFRQSVPMSPMEDNPNLGSTVFRKDAAQFRGCSVEFEDRTISTLFRQHELAPETLQIVSRPILEIFKRLIPKLGFISCC